MPWFPAGPDGAAGAAGATGPTGADYSLLLVEVEYLDSAVLALTDAGKLVRCDHVDAMTVTVPPSTGVGAVAFPVGTVVLLVAAGTGRVSVVAGLGVTIRSPGGKLKLTAQYDQASLVKRGADEWYLTGALSA